MSAALPATGLPREQVLARLAELRAGDLAARGGRTFAYVYDPARQDIDDLGHEVYASFLDVNGLDPTVFPSLLAMENDVCAIAAAHLGGSAGTVGTFTSGGTESIILAVKAARDRAGIAQPQVVLPVTAHAAFQKACQYLGVEAVLVDVDPKTFRALPAAMEEALTDRTVLLVASAASYAHGVVDPVAEIAAIGLARGIPVHVDGCIGGWLLPYFARLGVDVPVFDLSVPGVTSLSVDLHKYAYAPKGASVVLYDDAALRRKQYYACADWTGYTMVNATVQSTKSGGPLAAAWAVLHAVGDDGYLELARKTLTATRRVVDGVAQLPGLRVLGEPEMALVALASDEVDVFVVCDEMAARGWYVQPQLGYRDLPASLHLTLTASSEAVVDALLVDLADCVDAARGVSGADPGLLEAVAALDVDALPDDVLGTLLPLAGIEPGAGLPARMAGINALLEAMPPRLRERMLVEFLSLLFTPGPR
ncbi:MAG: aspartate aminotransferase family protein [Frankiales bacterium]|nr:aspartate aminotransferase family protein [Frankiales bacterium]